MNQRKRLHHLDSTYRVIQPGEVVREGDYRQIGRPPNVLYSLVCTPQTCRIWPCGSGIGHLVTVSGPFETYWTQRLGKLPPMDRATPKEQP